MKSTFLSARLLPIAFLAAAYVLIFALTHYAYLGDTMGYAQNVVDFDKDPAAHRHDFWDFGHLAWRPMGWLLFRFAGGFLPYAKTGETTLAVASLMISVSAAGGFITVITLQAIASRFLKNAWAAALVAIAFFCFHSFLNYAHAGSSYIAGLTCISLAFWSALRAGENEWRSRVYAVLCGAMAGCAVLFWFPYIVPAAGLVAVFCLWPHRANRGGLILLAFAIGAVLLFAAYMVPVLQLHLTSTGSLKEWIVSSSHGWSQNKRILRLISGLPRSFIWIGNEGTSIKRYLLHDPYVHVSLSQIIIEQIWRMGVFYLAAAAIAYILIRERAARPVLTILAAGIVPVLLFAVLIFEPGSIERYLPTYPYLCFAIAFCVSQSLKHRVAAPVIMVFLTLSAIVNLTALCRSTILDQHRISKERAMSLQNRVTPRGLVAVPSLMDDLYQFSSFFPFDPVVRKTALPVYDVVVAANERSRFWRQDFAKRAIDSLDHGEVVWISKRLLAARPDPSWGWNEGDDPNVTWRELPAFFNRLQYSEDTGDPDGFRRLVDSPSNRALLTQEPTRQ